MLDVLNTIKVVYATQNLNEAKNRKFVKVEIKLQFDAGMDITIILFSIS